MRLRLIVAMFVGALISPLAAAQTAKGDPGKAQQIVNQVCASCHGTDGNSTSPTNPILAGQHPEYTLKQLTNFKAQNGKPAERVNPVMGGMVASLSAEDMSNLAAYFAGQQRKPRAARDPDLVTLGQSIYRGGIVTKNVAACASCHSPTGAGIPAQFPRLAGQYAEYTAAQLRAFRAGERANDPNSMMRTVAARLSDREISAVAEYIAGLH
jgi:cytochrome c553